MSLLEKFSRYLSETNRNFYYTILEKLWMFQGGAGETGKGGGGREKRRKRWTGILCAAIRVPKRWTTSLIKRKRRTNGVNSLILYNFFSVVFFI